MIEKQDASQYHVYSYSSNAVNKVASAYTPAAWVKLFVWGVGWFEIANLLLF